mmetsp:Transcript_8374/g.19267  ORF Transcript_8374/g.19267 Transcript_8374/m.19267 type:complete len:210 (+) Transcript_8374:864-1493(+)
MVRRVTRRVVLVLRANPLFILRSTAAFSLAFFSFLSSRLMTFFTLLVRRRRRERAEVRRMREVMDLRVRLSALFSVVRDFLIARPILRRSRFSVLATRAALVTDLVARRVRRRRDRARFSRLSSFLTLEALRLSERLRLAERRMVPVIFFMRERRASRLASRRSSLRILAKPLRWAALRSFWRTLCLSLCAFFFMSRRSARCRLRSAWR